jgi:pilus assembly protein Flp/PilA
MMQLMSRLGTDDSGQDLAEYALLLALIAVVALLAVRLLGPTIAGFFNDVSDNLGNSV